MDESPLDRLTRVLSALRTRRAATALLAGAITPLTSALAGSDAKPKPQRERRRKPADADKGCRERCGKKKSKQARRRCRRRCPGTSPGPAACPTEGAEVVVASYADVKDDYARGSAVARPAGPDAVANFVNERFTDLYDQFSPELQTLISAENLAAFWSILQHNRVHFEDRANFGTFDGYFEGDYIQGYFTQVFTVSFWLVGTDPIPPGSVRPLEGRWEGQIYDPTGIIYQTPFDIVVTFTPVAGELTGTLDVAGIADGIVLTNISFDESRPLSTGSPVEELIIPAPLGARYTALLGWGDAHMAFTFFIDDQDTVIGLDIVPEWPLPPDPAAGLPVGTAFRLPMNGVWFISTGGPRHYANHHAADPVTRRAYDLGVWSERGEGVPALAENADFWAWEQPIFAPAAGTVIRTDNDVPDNQLGVVDTSSSGNYIILQTAPQEFVLMGHLRQGSVAVAVGEQVQTGQFLARVGNSGFSTRPHLHMQLTNRDIFVSDPDTISLPLHFKNLLVNGKLVANPSPVKGDFVQHAGCPTPVPAEYAQPPQRDRPNRQMRGSRERPMVTARSAEAFRSPAAMPVDGPPPSPWGTR